MTFGQFLITESIWDDIKEKWWSQAARASGAMAVSDKRRDVSIWKTRFFSMYEEDLQEFKRLKSLRVLTPEEADISNLVNISHREFQDKITEWRRRITMKQMKRDSKKGAKKIFEDDNVLIMQITTWEASCYYGRETKWCISSIDDEGAAWNSEVSDQDAMVYFMFDKIKKTKYAILVYPPELRDQGRGGFYTIGSVWNANDVELNSLPRRFELYKEYIIKDANEIKGF